MLRQDVQDEVEFALSNLGLPIGLREKILDSVWNVLCDEMSEDDE